MARERTHSLEEVMELAFATSPPIARHDAPLRTQVASTFSALPLPTAALTLHYFVYNYVL